MLEKYYRQELENLRELARDFSKVHPAAAPMLGGQSADPDVERLLEAVAFLTGMMRQKLDDELPEIVRGLMDVVMPHYLRPVPATTIVVFSPKPGLMEPVRVPAGTSIRSVAVDESDCIFRTCFDLEVHPLSLEEVELIQRPGKPPRIRLSLELKGMGLESWKPERLSFFLGGEYARAADLFLVLDRFLKQIRIVPGRGGSACRLGPESLRPVGFERRNSLFPFPLQAFSGYRLLQEYFNLPEKFLFFELTGWDLWKDRGDGAGFEIFFELDAATPPLASLGPDSFVLFATPAVNLFEVEADPVVLDHRQEKVRVIPSASRADTIRIYSVDRVVGFKEGTVEKRQYAPMNLFARRQPPGSSYQVLYRVSPVDGRPEVFLAFSYPAEADEPAAETLSIKLTCTNGRLTEHLQLGDICRPTFDSPELLDFRNITVPTAPVDPLLEGEELWRFLSHLTLNLLSLMDLEGLRSLLRLYIFPKATDRVKITANLKRVDGIAAVRAVPADTLVRGFLVRGREITLEIRGDHFAGTGDMLLFGSVLDIFFSQYSSINSFTRLRIKELISGETFGWPEKAGARTLL